MFKENDDLIINLTVTARCHAHCKGCGFGYNWKTGQSNTTAIVIYTAVIFAIVIAIYAAIGR